MRAHIGGLIPYPRCGFVRHASREWTWWFRITWLRTSFLFEVVR